MLEWWASCGVKMSRSLQPPMIRSRRVSSNCPRLIVWRGRIASRSHHKHGLRKRRRSCQTAKYSRYQADSNPRPRRVWPDHGPLGFQGSYPGKQRCIFPADGNHIWSQTIWSQPPSFRAAATTACVAARAAMPHSEEGSMVCFVPSCFDCHVKS